MSKTSSKIFILILSVGFLLCAHQGFANSESSRKTILLNKVAVKKEKKSANKNSTADKIQKDEVLEWANRFFQEADSVHREAWWVLVGTRAPVSKSPFGKVSRALQTAQNMKLANKSMFRCDRYKISRTAVSSKGYPQNISVFEHCNLKAAAQKIADVTLSAKGDAQVVFFPNELKELLGNAASTLNRPITCKLKGDDKLKTMTCSEWHQAKTDVLSIKLDTYEFQANADTLMILKGKVYEHLADIRKIEAVVPKAGKISVHEEELYPPQEEPVVVEKKDIKTKKDKAGENTAGKASKKAKVSAKQGTGAEAVGMDPDVMMQRQQLPPAEMHDLSQPVNDGWPTAEDGTPLPVMGEDGQLYYPEGAVSPEGNQITPEPQTNQNELREVDPNAR